MFVSRLTTWCASDATATDKNRKIGIEKRAAVWYTLYEKYRACGKQAKETKAYGYNKDDMWIRNADWLPTQFFRLLISDYYPGEYNWKLACKSEHSKKLFRETMEMAALLSKNSRRECENNA